MKEKSKRKAKVYLSIALCSCVVIVLFGIAALIEDTEDTIWFMKGMNEVDPGYICEEYMDGIFKDDGICYLVNSTGEIDYRIECSWGDFIGRNPKLTLADKIKARGIGCKSIELDSLEVSYD